VAEYGFYDRLTKDFPSQIIVDVCEVCNYECIHCPQNHFKKSKYFSGAFLSEELNKKLVDEVNEYGNGLTQQIRFTANGEPFLHPGIIDILEYAVLYSGTLISVTTNGSLLDGQKIERLLEMNIGLIDFSLDALNDETYIKIRRQGDFNVVRDNILKMLDLKKRMSSSTKIVVSFVKQEQNISEADDFQKYWEEKGVDHVVMRKCHSAAGFFYKNNKEPSDIMPCVFPWERIVLSPDGGLEFCPASWEGKTTIHPNYFKTTIHDLWNSDKYTALRNEHLIGKFNRFAVCGDCPDRESSIWPENRTKDYRGYGDMISDFISENNGK